jgi:alkylation response protein AidB-like acyl-CoA dehydrogenase
MGADRVATGGAALVAGLADLVETEAAASEAARTMTPPVVDAMFASGLATYMNPTEAGGAEPGARDIVETWIEAAALDGSFGWNCLANHSSTLAVAAYLPDAGFDDVFGAGPVVLGGQFAPNGIGTAADGGVRLSGSWQFGSGTGHAAWVAAGYLPEEVMTTGDFTPASLRVAILPREEITFTDGWFVQGLKGTGSYDYQVRDTFVPFDRTFPLFTREPLRGTSPIFRAGLMAVTAAGHAAWALGVSRSMLDDVVDLAVTRVRMGDEATLAHRDTFQLGLAHQRMRWRAAHLLVVDTFEATERAAATAAGLSPTDRADLRAAAAYVTDAAREVAEWAHLVAGTAAIREGSRLERGFRDLYTGTQHVFIGEKFARESAQVWLGLADDSLGL